MKLKEIRLLHEGQYLSYYEADYITDSGKTKTYEFVSKTGSRHEKSVSLDREPETLGKKNKAVVLFVFNEDHSKILLAREFRLGVNRWVWNNIAGLIDPGESIEEAAARELREETGLRLKRIVDVLPPSYICAPVTDDLTSVLIVEAEGELTGSDSETEMIECRWCTRYEANVILHDESQFFAGRNQSFLYLWSRCELETERLILRPWRTSDAEAMYEYAKDPRVGPNGGWKPHTSPENSIEVMHAVFDVPEHYAVIPKEVGKPVGCVGLILGAGSDMILEDGKGLPEGDAELGYWIGYPFWGRGYIAEASRELLRYGFEELSLNRVWCTCNVENKRSERVQDKCGFVFHHIREGVFRESIGDYRDKRIALMDRARYEELKRK